MSSTGHGNGHERERAEYKSVDSALFSRLASYLYPYRLLIVPAIILLIVARGIEAWIPVKLGQLAQTIVQNQDLPLTERKGLLDSVFESCLIVSGWIVFNYFLDFGNIMLKNLIGRRAIFKLRSDVFTHIQARPPVYFDRTPIGRLMTRTIYDVDQINQLFSESVIPLLGSLFLFIGILSGLFFLNWKVGLLFTVICPLIWKLLHYFRINQRRCFDTLHSIVSSMSAFIQEHLTGVNVIRNFGLPQYEKKKFEELNRDHYLANVQSVHYFSFFFSGIEYLQNLTMIAVFILLVSLHPGGSGFQVGTYFTISMYCLMIFRPLLDLAERYNIMQSAMASAQRIFELMDLPGESKEPEPGLPLEDIESIEFDRVKMAYEKDQWVLNGISFSLKKGESIAFVGTTGAGKTSILNAILRFYPIREGHIYINGHDSDKYSTATLRKHFGVVLQDPTVFSGTIFDNIALYDPAITQDRVEAAAEFVNLAPIVDRFPDRYGHIVSERGMSLSTGESQLISLARAVVHRRSAFILDEATANIDVQTEKAIQAALRKILTDKTAIVIAHRLSTIQDVTRILVLHKGVIAESGTHDQLLQAKGIYEKLYALQFASA